MLALGLADVTTVLVEAREELEDAAMGVEAMTFGRTFPNEPSPTTRDLVVFAATAGRIKRLLRARALHLAVDPSRTYEDRVQAMADALHEDCVLEWQAIAVVDPGRLVTQHMADTHYGQAHNLVRRLWPDLDS